MVVDEDGREAPARAFDADGRLANADRCVGEIVNTLGVGPFEGYYRNEEAMRRTTRNGWYWSGDLGYVDEDGWVYFAGRTSDWLRVDGENFPAAPIEAIIGRHPDVMLASVYGVPDADSGDQVMGAVVLREGATFDGTSFASWLDSQPDLSPKWRPRFVRLSTSLPTTPTNKVLTRTLVHEKFRSDRVGRRSGVRAGPGQRRLPPASPKQDELALRDVFESNGRGAAWDLSSRASERVEPRKRTRHLDRWSAQVRAGSERRPELANRPVTGGEQNQQGSRIWGRFPYRSGCRRAPGRARRATRARWRPAVPGAASAQEDAAGDHEAEHGEGDGDLRAPGGREPRHVVHDRREPTRLADGERGTSG